MLDRRISHVVAIARAGSFTKGAAEAGISQSGITKSIADLEAELGFALFHRTARGALMTDEGRIFVERAIALLEDARLLLTGNQRQSDPYERTLRIGTCPSSLQLMLVDPLAFLLQKHPAMRFDIVPARFERCAHLLRTGTIDVALGFSEAFEDWGEFQCAHISSVETILFARKDHPISRLESIDLTALGQYNFVVPSDSKPYGPIIRKLLGQSGEWRRQLHIVDFFPIVTNLVMTSDTIGMARRGYSQSPEFAEHFELVPVKDLFPPMGLCCATRLRPAPPAPVRAFINTLRSSLPEWL